MTSSDVRTLREAAQQDGTVLVARLQQLDEERARVQADIHRLEGRVQVLLEIEQAAPAAEFEIEPGGPPHELFPSAIHTAQFHRIDQAAQALPKETTCPS